MPARDCASSERRAAVLQRDAALARVGFARRLAIAGSAVLSAAFAGLVSTSPVGKAHAAPAAQPPAGAVSGGS